VRWDALVVHPADDVAVALRDVAAGEAIDVRRGGRIERVTVSEPIALGHKLALHAIARGSPIRKYGEAIGTATADIAAGAHVHVHNLASRRARTPS
jgi:predicted RecA/RadA family phage recombinase